MGNENDDSNNSNNNNDDWVSKTSKINDLRSGAGTGFQKAGGTFDLLTTEVSVQSIIKVDGLAEVEQE